MTGTLRNDLKTFDNLQNSRRPGLQRGLQSLGRDSLEQEMLSEMASALKRAETKVLSAIDVVMEALTTLEAAGDEASAEVVEAYQEAYAEAERARWEMIVHREAIGLRDSSIVRKMYPIPARLNV